RMDPGARLVQADDLDGLPAARVLRLDGVQGGDGRGVPDVRGGKVDDDPVGVGRVVEAADEVVGGREEQLARHPVDDRGAVGVGDRGDVRDAGHAPGEDDHRGDRADDDTDGEVVGGDHTGDGDQHDGGLADGHA